jgi:hypothetical protein
MSTESGKPRKSTPSASLPLINLHFLECSGASEVDRILYGSSEIQQEQPKASE